MQTKTSGQAPAKKTAATKTATKSVSKPVAKAAVNSAKGLSKAKAVKSAAAKNTKVTAAQAAAIKAAIEAPLRTSPKTSVKTTVVEVSVSKMEVQMEINPDAALLAPKTPVRSSRAYRPGAVEATKTLAELSNEPIEFKVGDNAVYPGHGVGRVNAIETKEIAGTKLTFYSIQILESGMKIMVPQANVKNVGLRPIISKEEATLVVSILKQTDVKIDNQTWNRRYREYMEKIKTGGVREIAEVLRDLFLLKVDKELSFGERKMLDTARSLLIKELILATGRDELMKEAEVKAILDLS